MILRTPVVPQYITVHLGSPKTAARNITVPFNDYIKNVASSEIYPTWPEAALRANIYAITSFALNRVYTEFYRAQGYPFDITSSTSYDQAFIEGREIFANISRLVDEQFNDYIVQRGQIQPMHSSYCNGTTATCPGLSQWGSFYLASEGFTPYRILQYYYGDDTDLVFNAPVNFVPPSFPGRLMRRGDIGESVRDIQKMLQRIRRNYPAIPPVTVNTGVFDGATDAAVREFQRVFGQTSDGIVGLLTWYRMVSIFDAVKRLSELESEGISAAEARTLYSEPLRRGDFGPDVKTVQYYLDFIALFRPEIPRVVPDGIFGGNTERAVRAFQENFGLREDGIVGRNTWNWLQSIYAEAYEEFREVAPTEALPIYPAYAFSLGDSGEKVRLLQHWLNSLSAAIPGLPSLTPDGFYGPATVNAVTQFQRYVQTPISGDTGPLTWNALAERYALHYGGETA